MKNYGPDRWGQAGTIAGVQVAEGSRAPRCKRSATVNTWANSRSSTLMVAVAYRHRGEALACAHVRRARGSGLGLRPVRLGQPVSHDGAESGLPVVRLHGGGALAAGFFINRRLLPVGTTLTALVINRLGHHFALSPSSTSRRMASEREGMPPCFADHLSTAARISWERRMAVTAVSPVAGRPRFFRTTVFVDVICGL